MDTELVLYYVNLLIIQYRDKPKAIAHITALVELIMIYDLIIQVRDGFDLDTAIGAQQDIIGKYIGVSRLVEGIDFTRTYFGFIEYADTPPVVGFAGYANYTDPVDDVQYRTYDEEGGSNLVLTDTEYRTMQRFKRSINYSCPSLKTIDDLLYGLFGTDAFVEDNEDMSISYTFMISQARLISIAESENIIPKPAGVRVELNFV